MVRTKIFNGKTYKFAASFRGSKMALARAKTLRAQGKSARTSVEGALHIVWARSR